MGRFERELLPAGLASAQDKLKVLERELFEINMQLDNGEEWADHSCDCEYCESRQYDNKKHSASPNA
jgi:hypothetical protein